MALNEWNEAVENVLILARDAIQNDAIFRTIISGKNINFTEFQEPINAFIDQIVKSVKVKDQTVRDLLKRYVAYYYFMRVAYDYPSVLKNFRNNIIQYSKLQEQSKFRIPQFFDVENNYNLINYYVLLHELKDYLLLTTNEQKQTPHHQFRLARTFLEPLTLDQINGEFLSIIKDTTDEPQITINAHGIIAYIIFHQLYEQQDKPILLDMLNAEHEEGAEFIYIDVVVSTHKLIDRDLIYRMFEHRKDADSVTFRFIEEIRKLIMIPPGITTEHKNLQLFGMRIVHPIVDDFLRYHRKTEIISSKDVMPILTNTNHESARNILIQQRKNNKDYPKMRIIVDKTENASELYSKTVQDNAGLKNIIEGYFHHYFENRKAILCNYIQELIVYNKALNDRNVRRQEYFLELQDIMHRAYFNFKNFQKYGTTITVDEGESVLVLRSNNIEHQTTLGKVKVGMRCVVNGDVFHMMGMCFAPFVRHVSRITVDHLLNLHTLSFTYFKQGKWITNTNSRNGVKLMYLMVKHFHIQTLNVDFKPVLRLIHDQQALIEHNAPLEHAMIYWIYDLETDKYEVKEYENIKSWNFQDQIRALNSHLHDRIMKALLRRIHALLKEHHGRPLIVLYSMIYMIEKWYGIKLAEIDWQSLMVYLFRHRLQSSPRIRPNTLRTQHLITYVPARRTKLFRMELSMRDPTKIYKLTRLLEYRQAPSAQSRESLNYKCQHVEAWNNMQKLKFKINDYNEAITGFMNQYVIETTVMDFVCKICGQVLPIKQFVADGSFNDATQSFVSAYTPSNMELQELVDYKKFTLTIQYLNALLNRMALITGVNLFNGNDTDTRQRRKALIKNIVDISDLHNRVMLITNDQRQMYMHMMEETFRINSAYDTVYYFELTDQIFDNHNAEEAAVHRTQMNMILLYFMICFMTELTVVQLTLLETDKIANSQFYARYDTQLFGDLRIKKNVNGTETVSVLEYPLFCYVLFVLAYYVAVKHKLWFIPNHDNKPFNVNYVRIVIHSFMDLINAIILEAGKQPDNYIYVLTSSKIFSQLNALFSNKVIMNILQANHEKYANRQAAIESTRKKIPKISLNNPPPTKTMPFTIPNFGMNARVGFVQKNLIYQPIEATTDVTHCPYGSVHAWESYGKDIRCMFCQEVGSQVTGQINRLSEAYYYMMNVIASRLCLDGKPHYFEITNQGTFCTRCGRAANVVITPANIIYRGSEDKLVKDELVRQFRNYIIARYQQQLEEKYPHDLLNELQINLNAQMKAKVVQQIEHARLTYQSLAQQEQTAKTIAQNILKQMNGAPYAAVKTELNTLLKDMQDILGQHANVSTNTTHAIYLQENNYMVNHHYDGSNMDAQIIDAVNMHHQTQHPFFKTDVYFYTDHATDIVIYYDAIYLRLLGYKEKLKDYVLLPKNRTYHAFLTVYASIEQRFLQLGYARSYLPVQAPIETQLQNYLLMHTQNVKMNIDRFIHIIYKLMYWQNANPSEEETAEEETNTNLLLTSMAMKWTPYLKRLSTQSWDTFNRQWNILKPHLHAQSVMWSKIFIPIINHQVHYEMINQEDEASNILMFFFLQATREWLQSITESSLQVQFVQAWLAILQFIFSEYDDNLIHHNIDILLFEYDINRMSHYPARLEHHDFDQDDENTITEMTVEEANRAIDLQEEHDAIDMETDVTEDENQDIDREDYE